MQRSYSGHQISMRGKKESQDWQMHGRMPSIPENLLEDLLRARSLNCELEALGYPHFLVKLYRRALRARGVMG